MRASPAIVVAICLTVSACDREPKTAGEIAKEAPIATKTSPDVLAPPASIGSADSNSVTEFAKKIKEFVELRDRLDRMLPAVPERATPKQIDAHQRQLGQLVAKERASARQGDLFSPALQIFIRGVVRNVVSGPEGARIKASLMDENPMQTKVEVNMRYPDTIPMSTMPPEILAALPELPKDLEYRFVGNRLILLDTTSHIILDFVESTFDL